MSSDQTLQSFRFFRTFLVALFLLFLAIIGLGFAGVARADKSFGWSNSDWGGIGLIQTRNARFGNDGQLDFGTSFVLPYQRYIVNLRAVPWLEGTFRYTLSNDSRFSQKFFDSTLTDRGADLKFPIFSESQYVPALAVGFQDLLGTGLFDGEYLVASKRYFDLDVSLGLAWGYPGQRGLFSNPFLKLSTAFENRRSGFSGTGGIPEVGRFFTGKRISPFFGLEYVTPLDGLRLKLEFDGNDYRNEPSLGRNIGAESPLNFGAEFRPWPWLTASMMFERGTQVAGRLIISSQLNESIGVDNILDQPLPALVPRQNRSRDGGDVEFSNVDAYASPEETTDKLFEIFEQRGLEIEEVVLDEGGLSVWISKTGSGPDLDSWGEAGETALRKLPISLSRITIAEIGSTETSKRSISVDARMAYDVGHKPAANSEGSNGTATKKTSPVSTKLFASIRKALDQENFILHAVNVHGLKCSVYVSGFPFRRVARSIGRAAVIVANQLPPEFEHIEVVLMNSGVATSSTTLLRNDLENARTFQGSPSEMWHNAEIVAPEGFPASASAVAGLYPRVGWGFEPKFRQHLGRPGQFHRFQFWGKLFGDVEVVRGLHLNGAIGRNFYHNFDDLASIPSSGIPHVRSQIVDYLNEGASNLVYLTVTHIANPAKKFYTRLTAGYLEEMFAGYGGEILYRPMTSRWAVGLEAHHVYQREFQQRLGLQDDPKLKYDVVTGHLTMYYQSPYHNISSNVSFGRYLAEDIGSTVQLSRMFESGVQMGGWFTLTNLSSTEFGEGSFDKGIFISIPLDLFFTSSMRQAGTFAFRPLTRDGGQMVNVNKRLYSVTGQGNLGNISRDWQKIFD